MPKVELHLHLEGAIPLPTMWELVERHGGDPEVPDPEALRRRFEFRDFAHFIGTWEWKLRFHTTFDDYELLAAAVAEDLARQGHRYVEAYVSPTDSPLPPGELLHAVRRGLDRHPEVTVALVPDLVRDTQPQTAMRTLEAVIEVASETGVVGITIGGSEQLYPAAPFAPVFDRAREAGLRLTAHAGEAAGPESVWQAVEDLGVDRIGHGVRAVEDRELVATLVERQIPLEMCPTSNVRTGVVDSLASHPIRRLIEEGAFVTLNTDDPAMFGCSLAGEYAALHALGVDLASLRMLSENAVDASWAPPAVKRDLHVGLATWWQGLTEAPVA
ncbi:MAG TPA: adenosine deaminase [Acidimicrobiia bacterium]|nr:adenosine deaminase [Acidimicrobiia bacterium]